MYNCRLNLKFGGMSQLRYYFRTDNTSLCTHNKRKNKTTTSGRFRGLHRGTQHTFFLPILLLSVQLIYYISDRTGGVTDAL